VGLKENSYGMKARVEETLAAYLSPDAPLTVVILGANMYILGVIMYIFSAIMYILGANMDIWVLIWTF